MTNEEIVIEKMKLQIEEEKLLRKISVLRGRQMILKKELERRVDNVDVEEFEIKQKILKKEQKK